eukprot:609110-Rhodomonas_salina.1
MRQSGAKCGKQHTRAQYQNQYQNQSNGRVPGYGGIGFWCQILEIRRIISQPGGEKVFAPGSSPETSPMYPSPGSFVTAIESEGP